MQKHVAPQDSGGTCFCTSCPPLRRDVLLHVLHVPCDRSPSQYVKLSLIWPVVRVGDVPMTNGIATNIFPFVTVVFARPEPSVPVMTLPQRAARLAHAAGHKRFPKAHPAPQDRRVHTMRAADKVK